MMKKLRHYRQCPRLQTGREKERERLRSEWDPQPSSRGRIVRKSGIKMPGKAWQGEGRKRIVCLIHAS